MSSVHFVVAFFYSYTQTPFKIALISITSALKTQTTPHLRCINGDNPIFTPTA